MDTNEPQEASRELALNDQWFWRPRPSFDFDRPSDPIKRTQGIAFQMTEGHAFPGKVNYDWVEQATLEKWWPVVIDLGEENELIFNPPIERYFFERLDESDDPADI